MRKKLLSVNNDFLNIYTAQIGLECEPWMMRECFFRAITIVVCDLNTWRQIVLCDEHEMGTWANHYGFGHQVSIAWVIHQTTEFSRLRCCVNAKRKMNGKLQSIFNLACYLCVQCSPVLLFIVLEIVHVATRIVVSSIARLSLVRLLHRDEISNVFDNKFASLEESGRDDTASFLVKHSHLEK